MISPATMSDKLQVQVDDFDAMAWQEVLLAFRDANIYNTWSYEGAVHPKSRVSRILLRRDGNPIAAVQARFMPIPVIGRGLAFIRWGPMWKPRGESDNIDNLRACLRAIHREFAVRRKMLVRIIPTLYDDDAGPLESVFRDEGFRPAPGYSPRRTLIMDLTPSTDAIRDNLQVKWRAHLKRAAKKQQTVTMGQGDEFFEYFQKIYGAMRDRKGFVTFTDFQAFRRLQASLPPREKPMVILCGNGAEYYSGAIVSALGDVGLYLFGATNGLGLQTNGNYLVHWRAIEWLKEQGCSAYDLNGINPEANPSTYMFKTRLAGKVRREVRELGMFQVCVDPLGRLLTERGLAIVESWRNRKLRRNAVLAVTKENDEDGE